MTNRMDQKKGEGSKRQNSKKANGPRVSKRSSGPVFANSGEKGWMDGPLDMNVL